MNEPALDTSHLQPWDRQPGESDIAFHAFKTYRDFGVDRSLSRVASELVAQNRSKGKVTTVRNNIAIWSKKNRWVERCAAWDRHLDRLGQVEEQKARVEMRRRQAEAAQAMQVVLLVPHRAILDDLRGNPDALLERLKALPVDERFDLAAKAARAFPIPVNVERSARGDDVVVDETFAAEEVVDRVSEEERLRRVARIMAEHDLLPPADIVVENGQPQIEQGQPGED